MMGVIKLNVDKYSRDAEFVLDDFIHSLRQRIIRKKASHQAELMHSNAPEDRYARNILSSSDFAVNQPVRA
jgi:hypothetical protein